MTRALQSASPHQQPRPAPPPFLIALLLVLTASGAHADGDRSRQGDVDPSALFIGRVDVSVVNVEVFVSDRAGNPVSGLNREDFLLLKDGEPVEISNFYAAERPAHLEESLRALASAERRSNDQEAFLPSDRQLNLVVYVDHANLRPNNRKRVLDDLRGFLTERAGQGDNVMLVGYSSSVQVEQPFTRDVTRILDGLDRLGKAATRRQIDDLERRRILARVAESAQDTVNRDPLSRPIDGIQTAYGSIRNYVLERRSELRLTTKALRDTLRSLAGLPGRKALIYVSDGLPARPGEELYQAMADLFSAGGGSGEAVLDPTLEALRDDQGQVFNELIREANAQQVTFYPVDARGPRGEGRLSSEFGNQSAGPAGNVALAALAEASLQEPLIAMASATGGRSILNTFAFDAALGKAGLAFDSFYSLGFTLPEGGDGAFHALEVIVRHPDYKVRHRSGFQDKPEAERVGDRTLSSLFLEANDNPLGIGLTFGEPAKKKGNFELPILVRIPFRELTLVPQGEQQQGRLQIFLAVRDEEGRVSALHQQPYPVSLTRAQAQQAKNQDIGYSAQLAVRPGTATVAVGVWDEVSGIKAFVQERVLVGNRRLDGGGRRRGARP